jgi:hypothetical protein
MQRRLLLAVTRSTSVLILFIASCLFYRTCHFNLTDIEAAARAAPLELNKSWTLAKLPVDFFENPGKWKTPAQFVARNGAMAASFERDGIRLQLGKDQRASHLLTFEGASQRVIFEDEGRSAGYYNFLIGNEPAKRRSRVAAYGSLLYRGLYKGIDVRVRAQANALEYVLGRRSTG